LTSYKKLYMFFSFFDKLFRIIPTYPVRLFNKISFKIIFRFIRMYFILKPYWQQVSKFYELLFLYININSKINIYILDNQHLSAQFLATYIMTSLYYKFDYRDTMIPIKKTLYRIMFSKPWLKPNHLKAFAWNKAISRFNTHANDRIDFYKDLNYFNLNRLYRIKISKYLQTKNYYWNSNINYWKKLRFKKFNISIFKKNLLALKKKVLTVDFLFKKNKIKLKKKKKIFNNF